MSLQNDTLKNYAYNKLFIETGTALGDGVQYAIDVGFKEIYSIEYYRRTWQQAYNRFRYAAVPVAILSGESPKILSQILPQIDESITFFLDAHYMQTEDTPKMLTEKACPILDELRVIGEHHIKTHTILIDDWRLFGSNRWGISESNVIQALASMGRGKIRFIDGAFENDILVLEFRK